MVAADDNAIVQNKIAVTLYPKAAAGAGRAAAGNRSGTVHLKVAADNNYAALFGFLRQCAVNGEAVKIQLDPRARRNRQRRRPCGRGHV